jgi:hypothetical protein
MELGNMKMKDYRKLVDKIDDDVKIKLYESFEIDVGRWFCKNEVNIIGFGYFEMGQILIVKRGFTHNSYEIRHPDGSLRIQSSHLRMVSIIEYLKFKENFVDEVIGKRLAKLNKLK